MRYRLLVHVVITRDSEDGAPFAQALGPAVTAVFMPVTTVVPADPEDLAALHARAAHLDEYAHLFVASRHAVPPLVAALSAHGRAPATAPPATAVGPATAAALGAAGFPARSRGDTGDDAAAALVALGVAGARILMPRARGGRDEPLTRLRAAGAAVDDVIAYQLRTAAAAAPDLAAGLAALSSGRAAACLVFAPSQVTALVSILATHGGLTALPSRGTALVAIGPTTAAALAAHGAPAAAIAAAPTPEAMAKALASVYPDVCP
jgi:uroporphyrinogen-III synthase